MIFIHSYSIIHYTYIDTDIVILLDNILNKVKSYLNKGNFPQNKKCEEVKPEINKQKIRYNKHGFPTYSPRNIKDSELNRKL